MAFTDTLGALLNGGLAYQEIKSNESIARSQADIAAARNEALRNSTAAASADKERTNRLLLLAGASLIGTLAFAIIVTRG